MPRIARKNYESSYFHVIVQGYEKQYIFEDDYCKKKYIELLIKEMNNYEIEILEYCIMDNHAHMLLFCKKIDQMSKYMKSVNIQYAIFYNREKNRVGYVFRDRYLSEPIMNERQLYNCIAYIHYNPVKAKMVRELGDYKFSSYMDFVEKKELLQTKN